MKTERTKSSLYNAIVTIVYTGVLSILSLISTNLILKNYGSDFNGVVATASQIVNFLMIVEGGFSLAINVALFKPFIENNNKVVSSIMSAAKKTFFKIGILFLSFGILISIIYPLFIKSNLSFFVLFIIFVLVIMSTAFNLMFIIKYQTMFQVSQKEYIYTSAGVLINVLSSISVIILVSFKIEMLIVRICIFLFSILNGFITYLLYKKRFKNINLNATPDYESIKGTKDILVQKLTSVIYNSSPLLFISTFISTKMSSVYAVYLSIYNIVKMFVASVISAPINGFGQLLSKEKSKKIYNKYLMYEYLIIVMTCIFMSAVLVTIIPFIRLYTANVTDINYVNKIMTIMIAAIVIIELVHLPAGNIINITGNFKVERKIQSVVCIILVTLLLINGILFGIYGVLGSIIVSNLVLSYLEINYTHTKIFNSSILNFIKPFMLNTVLMILLVIMGNLFITDVKNYLYFFIVGIVTLIIMASIIILINYIFFRKICNEIIVLLKSIKKQK